MILSAQTIRKLCAQARPLIAPFAERTAAHGFSYGLSSCGYDVRIAQDIWLWPFWGRLASTVERFDIPADIMGRVCDKSSWARRFVLCQNTVLEPGWCGHVTLELTRFLPWPIRIRAGTPIAQVTFERLDWPTAQPYVGRYQDQPARPVAAIQATAANLGLACSHVRVERAEDAA